MMRKFALSLLLFLAAGAALGQGKGLEVFYLGAPDCPYCRQWESRTRPGFLASPEGKAVKFVEIRGETLRQPIEARHYPPAYRWVFEQVGPSRGVPRFLLAEDGKVVHTAFGTDGFERVFLPALKKALLRRSMEKKS
jgi:hypothetical protein